MDLLRAASEGDVSTIDQLIAARTNLGVRDQHGAGPLHYAINGKDGVVSAKHLEVVRKLLDGGAMVDQANDEGDTPLFWARYKPLPFVQTLLAAKANVNYKNKRGETPLSSIVCSVVDLEVVKALIEAGAEVNESGGGGWALLHLAIANKRADIVQVLLEAKAAVNQLDATRSAPLHMAISFEFADIAQILIESGADVDRPDAAGSTPLHWAVDAKIAGIVVALIAAGAYVNKQNMRGYTSLHRAVMPSIEEREKQELVEYEIRKHLIEPLLNAGADANCQSLKGNTPLHKAAKYYPEAVSILLEHMADPSIKNRKGYTPLDSIKIWEIIRLDEGLTPLDIIKIEAAAEAVQKMSACWAWQRENKRAIADILAIAKHPRLGATSPMSLLSRYELAEIAHKAALAERGIVIRLPERKSFLEMAMALSNMVFSEADIACMLAWATHHRLGAQSPMRLLPGKLLAEIAHQVAVPERYDFIRLPVESSFTDLVLYKTYILNSHKENMRALAYILSKAHHRRLGSQSPMSVLPKQLLANIARVTALYEVGTVDRTGQEESSMQQSVV
jgi:ankyrin repeat protein